MQIVILTSILGLPILSSVTNNNNTIVVTTHWYNFFSKEGIFYNLGLSTCQLDYWCYMLKLIYIQYSDTNEAIMYKSITTLNTNRCLSIFWLHPLPIPLIQPTQCSGIQARFYPYYRTENTHRSILLLLFSFLKTAISTTTYEDKSIYITRFKLST